MSSCHSDHCITCSRRGGADDVIRTADPSLAICDGDTEVMTDLVGAVEPGDSLLVHAGVALVKL